MASNGSDPTRHRPGASEALGVKEAGELKDDPGPPHQAPQLVAQLPRSPARCVDE